MARIKYSAIVDTINGSIAGTTFQRNLYGSTVKSKPIISRPQKFTQQKAKLTVANNSQSWVNLSDSQRLAWQSWAEAYPVPTRLNPDSILNGQAFFNRYQGVWQSWFGSVSILEPSGTPGTATYSDAFLNKSGSQLRAFGDFLLTGGDWWAFIYATPIVRASRNNIDNIYKFMRAVSVPVGEFDVDISFNYLASFGRLPIAGDAVGLKVIMLEEPAAQWHAFKSASKYVL
ncbi:MAG: hypothetical protein ACRC4U_15375 [Shewanella sp.]